MSILGFSQFISPLCSSQSIFWGSAWRWSFCAGFESRSGRDAGLDCEAIIGFCCGAEVALRTKLSSKLSAPPFAGLLNSIELFSQCNFSERKTEIEA